MNRRDFVILTGASVLGEIVVRPALAQPLTANGANSLTRSTAKSAHWLRRYKGNSVRALYDDPRFVSLFADTVSATSGERMSASSLMDRIRLYTGVPGQITFSRGRYMVAGGCMSHCGFNRALLWIDTFTPQANQGRSVPLAVVALMDVDGPLRKITLIANCSVEGIEASTLTTFRKDFAKWLGPHAPSRRLAGGRINMFEVRSPVIGRSRLTPQDIGLVARRCDPPLAPGTLL